MYMTLSPGALGVNTRNLQEALDAAKSAGYAGLEFGIHEVADLIDANGAQAVKEMFCAANLWPAAFGMPVEFRGDEGAWKAGLAELPRLAAAARAIGCRRTMTWIAPASNDLTFDENLQFHVERLRPVSEILTAHDCWFGLEFVGPKTCRDGAKHPFIYRMPEMLDMCAQIGGNMGLLLDCWHWHSSGGTLEDILALRSEQVVYVHVSDAPIGVPLDALEDFKRCMPGATGVIDLPGFLQALQKIGYDGPVTPEPFGNGATWGADALRGAWRAAGL